MQLWKSILLCFLVNLDILNLADAEPLKEEHIGVIDSAVKKLNPNFDINDAIITWVSEINLYQVLLRKGLEVFFISKDGRYFFYGDLIDLSQNNKNKRNITNNSKKTIRKKALLKFPQKEMLVFKPDKRSWGLKKPLSVVTVFTDLDCPYGNKLHQEVEKVTLAGVEVRYLFFPRAGIDSESYKKAVSVWCSKDPNKAFKSATEGQVSELRECKSNPIKEQWNFARQLGINATPSIIFMDGTLISGYIPSDALITMVKENDAHSHSGS